jgi:hypothetical protein
MQEANCCRLTTPYNLGPAARYRGLLFFGASSCDSFNCFKHPAKAGLKLRLAESTIANPVFHAPFARISLAWRVFSADTVEASLACFMWCSL